jgi:hypothetical protein
VNVDRKHAAASAAGIERCMRGVSFR